MTPRDAAAIRFCVGVQHGSRRFGVCGRRDKSTRRQEIYSPGVRKCEAKKAVKGLVEEIQKSQGVMV